MTPHAPSDAVDAALKLLKDLPEGRTREVLCGLLTEHSRVLREHAEFMLSALTCIANRRAP